MLRMKSITFPVLADRYKWRDCQFLIRKPMCHHELLPLYLLYLHFTVNNETTISNPNQMLNFSTAVIFYFDIYKLVEKLGTMLTFTHKG